MNTLSFTYTKKDGSTSERVLAVMVKPSAHYAGIDISELSEVEQGQYIAAVEDIYMRYLQALEAINDDFDTKNRYRQFDPKLMKIHLSEELN